jgi:hypothetical protein
MVYPLRARKNKNLGGFKLTMPNAVIDRRLFAVKTANTYKNRRGPF